MAGARIELSRNRSDNESHIFAGIMTRVSNNKIHRHAPPLKVYISLFSCCTLSAPPLVRHIFCRNIQHRIAKMKENYTQLYPNQQVATAVTDYCHAHSSALPKHITEHHAWGVESQKKANYMVSPLQAQFHLWFAKALGVKRGISFKNPDTSSKMNLLGQPID